ncbi:hypothetical protein [Brevibacillus laterosporus]|uniref:hypothetical protein n=1 Tax=Brevibacillus laterosporus TaxID=1465 RepID=UPI000E6BCC1F|nr:hypothetical protein [Brevibacillus laterosporus]AYB37671.1 hypothetical protein D5F52_04880 [Brevibacillus laterosporus]MBM7111568.1 hypothetical protein [Brevibacillus laterosporus]
MLKQIFGFDQDTLKKGQAVKIGDKKRVYPSRKYRDPNETEYENENLAGNYLVYDVEVLLLKLTTSEGGRINVPINHFTGENPRMTIRILE